MDKEIIFIIEGSIEGGYEARALGHSIYTQGETYEEVKKSVLDAVHCHFEQEDLPSMMRFYFIKDEVMAV